VYMEEKLGNVEDPGGPDLKPQKLTLSKLLQQDRERVDGELYRAAVHRRRTWLRLRLQ